MHVDMLRVNHDTRIDIEVPVHFINGEDSPGMKRGGVLNIVRHKLLLNCPAGAIPESIDADVGEMDIGDALHMSAVTLPENITSTITNRDFTIVTLQGSRAVLTDIDEDAEVEVTEGEEGETEATEGGEE